MEGISVHCKGKGPCLKGESGLEKKESDIILRKIGSFAWFVQVGSGYTRVIQDALALSSLSHTFFFLASLYKILPQLRVVIAESHVNASGHSFDILFPCGDRATADA